jgi:outer membrane lipoprotein-sorting protein
LPLSPTRSVRRRVGRRLAAAAVVLSALIALAAVPQSLTVFDSYRTALANRKAPLNMEFEYTVTRSGPNRIVTEQHRVYWTASGLERNDTIAVNGTPVVPARSRLLHRTSWPYDVAQFVVSTDEYDVARPVVSNVAGRKAYVFTVTRATQADFMITSLYLDASSRLPLRETFVVAGSNCQGSGSIEFLPVGVYWLPTFVSVLCTGAAQDVLPAPVYKEAIRFSGYSFPATIPPDVFGQTQPAGATSAPLPTSP